LRISAIPDGYLIETRKFMKHAGPNALDELEPILREIRKVEGLTEKENAALSIIAAMRCCIFMKTH